MSSLEIRSEPQPVPHIAWPSLAAGFGGALLSEYREWGWGWSLLIAVGFILFAAFIVRHTSLNPAQRTVTVTHRWCGRWTTRREEIPFDQVDAVCFRPFRDSDVGHRVLVGIRLLDGRKFWLRAFDVDTPPIGWEAQRYAETVRDQTGLRIDETIRSTPG